MFLTKEYIISLRARNDNKGQTAPKITATKKQGVQAQKILWQTTIQ
jgi:hypothetical protein